MTSVDTSTTEVAAVQLESAVLTFFECGDSGCFAQHLGPALDEARE